MEEKKKLFVYINTHCTPESFLTDTYILNYSNSLQINLMEVLLFLVYTRKTWKHRVFKYIIQDNYLLGSEELNKNQLQGLIAGTCLAAKSWNMVHPVEDNFTDNFIEYHHQMKSFNICEWTRQKQGYYVPWKWQNISLSMLWLLHQRQLQTVFPGF